MSQWPKRPSIYEINTLVWIHGFYGKLRSVLRPLASEELEWRLCESSGWPDNSSFENVLAWSWSNREQRYLVVVNFSDLSAQCRVHMSWHDLAGCALNFTDLFTGEVYHRIGDEFLDPGLFVDLHPWGYHLLKVTRG